jgi:hypothetical protein
MNMKECTITQQQPGEKRADNHDVLANEQPFGRMGQREANASAARSLPPDEISFVTCSQPVIDGGLTAH